MWDDKVLCSNPLTARDDICNAACDAPALTLLTRPVRMG